MQLARGGGLGVGCADGVLELQARQVALVLGELAVVAGAVVVAVARGDTVEEGGADFQLIILDGNISITFPCTLVYRAGLKGFGFGFGEF